MLKLDLYKNLFIDNEIKILNDLIRSNKLFMNNDLYLILGQLLLKKDIFLDKLKRSNVKNEHFYNLGLLENLIFKLNDVINNNKNIDEKSLRVSADASLLLNNINLNDDKYGTETNNNASLLLNNINLNDDKHNTETNNNASLLLDGIELNNVDNNTSLLLNDIKLKDVKHNNILSITELSEALFNNDMEIEESDNETEYNKENILVYFKMTNCSACKNFENEWYKIIKNNTNNLKFSEVNCLGDNNEKKMVEYFNINEYPTLLLIKNNNKHLVYEGLLNENDVRQFLLNNLN